MKSALKTLIPLIIIAIMSLIAIKCKKIYNIEDDLQIGVNTDIVKTSGTMLFKDAATGNLIGNENKKISISFVGEDKDKIVDAFGSELTNFESENGFYFFGLHPSINLNETGPIDVNAVIHVEGYLSTFVPISLTEDNAYFYEVSMVAIDNPPNGVSSIVDNSGSLTNGIANMTTTIETPQISTSGIKASLTIPEGILMKDADGRPLNGIITTTFIYFSNKEDEALSAFPGGFNVKINEGNAITEGLFYSLGFVSIEITDESGKKAKTFENGQLDVNIELPPNTYNPTTESNIKDGDLIPSWSLEIEEGIWEKERIDTIRYLNSEGKYVINSKLSHLTIYNWDIRLGFCNKGLTLIFVYEDQRSIPIRISIIPLNGGMARHKSCTIENSGDGFNLVKASINIPTKITVSSPYGVTEIVVDNLCEYKDIYFYLNNSISIAPPEAFTLKVDLNGYCPSNPNILVYPTGSYGYKLESASGIRYGFGRMVNGHTEIDNVLLGDELEVYVGPHAGVGIVDNTSYTFDSVPFTIEACDFFE